MFDYTAYTNVCSSVSVEFRIGIAKIASMDTC